MKKKGFRRQSHQQGTRMKVEAMKRTIFTKNSKTLLINSFHEFIHTFWYINAFCVNRNIVQLHFLQVFLKYNSSPSVDNPFTHCVSLILILHHAQSNGQCHMYEEEISLAIASSEAKGFEVETGRSIGARLMRGTEGEIRTKFFSTKRQAQKERLFSQLTRAKGTQRLRLDPVLERHTGRAKRKA